MEILNRYLLVKFLKINLVVLLAVSGIIWLSRIIPILEIVTSKDLGFGNFLGLIFLVLPPLFFILLPITLFVSSLIFANMLFNSREVLIFRASGLNDFQIKKLVFYLASIVFFLNLVISFSLSPYSYRQFKDLKNDVQNNFVSMMLRPGTVNYLRLDLVIFADQKQSGNRLNKVMIYENFKGDNEKYIIADQAKVIKDGKQFLVSLDNGIAFQKPVNDDLFAQIRFNKYSDDLEISDKSDDNRALKLKERSFADLFLSYQQVDSAEKNEILAEGFNRIIWPILCIILPLITLTIILSSNFNRIGQRTATFIATSIGLGLLGYVLFIKNFIVKNPELAFYQLVALLFIVAILLNWGTIRSFPRLFKHG